MKREALGSTKMKKFCRLLSVRQYVAVGILESLWHLTAKEAPAGNIGKLSNEDIALGLDWEKDPDDLIKALLESRWIDESEKFRLLVHDWHEHADDAVNLKVARAGKLFATGQRPKTTRLAFDERNKVDAALDNAEKVNAHEQPTARTRRAHGKRTKAHKSARKRTTSTRASTRAGGRAFQRNTL